MSLTYFVCIILFLTPAAKEEIQPQLDLFYARELVKAGLFQDEKTAFEAIEWEKQQEDPAAQLYYFLIHSEGNECGYLVYSVLNQEAYLQAIYVQEEWRGKGIASAVLSKMESEFPVIKLFVFAHNFRALHLYEKLGYEIEETCVFENKVFGYHMKKSPLGSVKLVAGPPAAPIASIARL